jgi:catechol 2,3-dioxygenase-like lactoylglutathione lyase family enzyme
VIDVHDAEVVGQFWADVLGWRFVERGGYSVSMGIENGPCEIEVRLVRDGLKISKNRIHLDLTPAIRSLAAERDRLLALRACEVDGGQGQRRWYVLADPEGNEFCVCPVPSRRIVSAAVLPRSAVE